MGDLQKLSWCHIGQGLWDNEKDDVANEGVEGLESTQPLACLNEHRGITSSLRPQSTAVVQEAPDAFDRKVHRRYTPVLWQHFPPGGECFHYGGLSLESPPVCKQLASSLSSATFAWDSQSVPVTHGGCCGLRWVGLVLNYLWYSPLRGITLAMTKAATYV